MMLPALYDDQRASLLRVAAMLVFGSLCTLPLTMPGTGTVRADEMSAAFDVRLPEVPSDVPARAIVLHRDPFTPEGDTGTSASMASLGNESLPDIVLPPNAGAAGLPPDAQSGGTVPLVRALVLGTHSRALIDRGGQVAVYGIGDHIGDAAISSIDAGGVVLTNGVRLPVVTGAQ